MSIGAGQAVRGGDTPRNAANRPHGSSPSRLRVLAALGGACLIVVGAGCGGAASQFQPAGAQAAGRAAYYEIQAGGRVWGDARVWSPDGYLKESDEQGLMLTARIRVRNDSDEAITFAAAESFLEYISEGGNFIRVTDTRPAPESISIPARSTSTVLLSFQLEGKVEVEDMRGFEINWFIETPGGRYSESTPFQRVEREETYYYAPSYYYPYSPFYGGGVYMGHGWRVP